jgi:hypothetical protein
VGLEAKVDAMKRVYVPTGRQRRRQKRILFYRKGRFRAEDVEKIASALEKIASAPDGKLRSVPVTNEDIKLSRWRPLRP